VRVLVVGSGGREHALTWKIARSPELEALHCAPGNPGMAALADCHPVRPEDAEGLLALARELEIDLVVVGPEAPLVAGLADHLRHAGIKVFGPGKEAAQIEGSKSFAKEVMAAAGVPHAGVLAVARIPCVVKADGLAGGKGVWICETQEELDSALRAAAALGDHTVIEELLRGPELSVFALVAGADLLPLPSARDYSRVGDGDTGPNTGGMGCFSPVPGAPDLVDSLLRPVVEELARRGAPFVGCLYGGAILTDEGPRILEYNCRFGDPEAQVILPRLDGDLLPALVAAASGDLDGVTLPEGSDAAVAVALAAGTYPEKGDSGTPIDGIEGAEAGGALVFHAGTALRDGRLVTNGGRILSVTGTGATVAEARERAYAGVERIHFEGARYRTDIARKVEEGAHVG
jgi:phosphoribosylamine---glycine ligase